MLAAKSLRLFSRLQRTHAAEGISKLASPISTQIPGTVYQRWLPLVFYFLAKGYSRSQSSDQHHGRIPHRICRALPCFLTCLPLERRPDGGLEGAVAAPQIKFMISPYASPLLHSPCEPANL